MTSDEVYKLIEANGLTLHGDIEHFAELVAQHQREKDREQAVALLRQLHDNFSLESAELRIHQWASKDKNEQIKNT